MKTTFTLLAFVLLLVSNATAQDEGYMYGKIVTVDDQVYQGPIRWGKEEVLWVDLFNAAKPRNNNLDYLSREDVRRLEDKQNEHNHNWGERFVSRWVSYTEDDRDFTHQFVVQFGDISTIRPSWRDRAEITLRNGTKIEVDGEGYNDVGTEVRIQDNELGEVSLDWSRIELITFMTTPMKLDHKFGEALYGTVETSHGNFQGYIAWDNDERLGTDKLDGNTNDGKVSLEFSKVASIRQSWNDADVELKSGRILKMCCTNDVNDENRGIVVEDEKLGKALVPWDELRKVTFTKPGKMKGYNEFKSGSEINGTVTNQEGKSFAGKLVYDLDESLSCEVLQGKDGDIEFFLPFRDITAIHPKGWRGAEIQLKNGSALTLEEGQDVTDLHQGMLVFSGTGDPQYVRWEDVKEIKLN